METLGTERILVFIIIQRIVRPLHRKLSINQFNQFKV